jgi:DNA-binding NtrC family response regulator
MARILVVDDEVRMAALIRRELEDHGHEVTTAGDGAVALERLAGGGFDLMLTDLRMPGLDGLALLRRAREDSPGTEVVLMTAYASAQTAVQAMKEGAYDYLIKPFEMDELLIMVERIAEQGRMRLENRQLQRQAAGEPPAIIGTSEAIRRVMQMVDKVAGQEATVLLSGESGTGKELVARAIHDRSPRRDGPMVTVNCAAIPETLLEAELFGHERGAFTGAESRRLGRFEMARRGTVLLDEVARNGWWSGWEAVPRSRWTCAWSRPPTATWANSSPGEPSARTSTTGSTSSPSTSPPCGSAGRIYPCWPLISWPGSGGETS